MSAPLELKQAARGSDLLLSAFMGTLAFALLYVTSSQIGYARDEGFYFQAAEQYGRWLQILWSDPARAIQKGVVEAHFAVNSEHPSLMKLLFALSEQTFHARLGWVSMQGQAYRIAGMWMAALSVALTVGWTTKLVSRSAGLFAGVLLLTLPRWFHHAHLACFDVPVATMVLLCTVCYRYASGTKRLLPALLLGVVFGLALDTKHNAWWLPFVFLLHLAITEGKHFRRGSNRQRWEMLRPLVAMLLIGPAILVLLWPWLWFDPIGRLRFWVEFHLHHEYYNMEFLGQTYHRPPMPRGYAWLMTLATVPATTMVLALVGMGVSIAHAAKSLRSRVRVYSIFASVTPPLRAGDASKPPASTSKPPSLTSVAPADTSGAPVGNLPVRSTLFPAAWDERRTTELLLWLSLLAAYAPWWFTSTPIFGGTKHWLVAYPFLCMFGARGYAFWVAQVRQWLGISRERSTTLRWLTRVGTLSLLAPAAVITWDSVPWGLSAYTPLVGGAPGAATLGLNRTFWGYTSLAMADTLHELAPNGARVFVHDTALQSWQMHQIDGTIEQNLSPTLNIAQSNLALYHHEPHMERVEYQIWEAYGTTAPEAIACFDGVPVVWLYARPGFVKAK